MTSDSEQQLLAQCGQGVAEAWDTLFDLHYQATGRFVFQLDHRFSREDVEEICQETFLTVVRSLSKFQGNSKFQTWLFHVAGNKARDFRQKRNAVKRGGQEITMSLHEGNEEGGSVVDPPSAAAGPDELMIREEDFDLLGKALENLGEPCQEIIELRYYGDLSYEELSRTLNLNPKTVSSRLSKCLDKLELATKNLMERENRPTTSV